MWNIHIDCYAVNGLICVAWRYWTCSVFCCYSFYLLCCCFDVLIINYHRGNRTWGHVFAICCHVPSSSLWKSIILTKEFSISSSSRERLSPPSSLQQLWREGHPNQEVGPGQTYKPRSWARTNIQTKELVPDKLSNHGVGPLFLMLLPLLLLLLQLLLPLQQ